MLTEKQNLYLDYLIEPKFQGENRLFVLSFEDNAHRTRHARYFLPKTEIKDYKKSTCGKKLLLISHLKNDLRTYNKIRKIATDRGDDYQTCCLLDYNYFKENYKLIAIDLSK